METPLEKTNHSSTPTLQGGIQGKLKPNLGKAITEQPDADHAVAVYLVGVWVGVRIEVLQIHHSLVPLESHEEIELIKRMMRRFGSITPSEFATCIRLAAEEKQRFLSDNPTAFAKLYAADFEDQIQRLNMKKQREAEGKAALQLPQNVAGNAFWGTPAEALAREWPKIVGQTKVMRAINPTLRDRFWVMGSIEQKDSAFGMLGQMVKEMKEAGTWDQQQVNWEALAIFQADFRAAFPQWDRLLDAGMTCPLRKSEVDELHQRVRWKIQAATDAGGDVPSLANFPDPQDATFCAVFDAYWKFRGEG